ncbi:MAG: gamma-glutamyl-gamma-aminobutyrate hydrolase family protein, partial [Lachnospiraceae bacterium]|nr:gamma-glutamyl-gamma-aminobutyrate hydrolase family protein [Lachnospiraceae bacterium]
MILLIDNYDSFSYNLYQLLGAMEPDIRVIRNDELSLDEIKALNPSAIVLSPGPGRPKDAGVCEEAVREFYDKIPILGVCLGHQAICEALGGKIDYAKQLMHGKQSDTRIDKDSPIFMGLPDIIKTARYHSLASQEASLPGELKITAMSEDGEIMAVEHREHHVYGLQFHPESVMTPDGREIIRNFIDIVIYGQIRKDLRPDKNLKRREKMVIEEAIVKLVNKEDLTPEMAEDSMNEIMSGEVPS